MLRQAVLMRQLPSTADMNLPQAFSDRHHPSTSWAKLVMALQELASLCCCLTQEEMELTVILYALLTVPSTPP